MTLFEELLFYIAFVAVAAGTIYDIVQVWRSGEARAPGGGGRSALLKWRSGVAGRTTIVVLVTLLFIAAYLLFEDQS
jgi:hypothetical protein